MRGSIDIHGVYCWGGTGWGLELTRPRIIQNTEDYFGDEIAVLPSPGLSHLLMFQCEAVKTLNLISCDEHGLDNAIYKVGTQITKECLSMKTRHAEYCKHADKATAQYCVIPTLLSQSFKQYI